MTYLIILILIFFSALFSGLTIGLLGLDKSELKRKIKLGHKQAKRIYEVRKNGNLLLVVLLLGNVLINSILSVYLGQTFSGLLAVLFSTILIVLFGEIVPQAIFYRNALKLGYYFVPIVKLFTYIFYPIAYPLAKLLDKFLGTEKETIWSKKEIEEIIKVHEDSNESDIDRDEEKIVLGALTFSEKKVEEVMTPKKDVFFLKEDEILTHKLLKKIKDSGFTRIPVYKDDYDNIVGVLNVKSLIDLPAGKKTVQEVCYKNKIFAVRNNEKLDNLLNKFILKKSHIAYVVNEHGTLLGIVTLEDLIENIINTEIIDETDRNTSKAQN